MSSSLIKTLLLATLITLSCQLFDNDTKVVQLDQDNFEKEVLKSKDLWLILFYAPWCGHCKRFHPEYEKAAKGLEGIFKIGAVDCTKSTELAGKYEIRGYPTVKFFNTNKNDTEKYTGARTAVAVADFLFEKARKIFNERLGIKEEPKKEEPKKEEPKKEQPKKEEPKKEEPKKEEPKKEEKKDEKKEDESKDVIVLTDDNFNDQVFGTEDMWMVAFYAPWCGHCKRLLPEWNIAATKLKGKVKIAKLDATVNKKMAGEYKINGYPTIKIFSTGKGKDKKAVEEYSGSRKSDDLVKYALDKLKTFQEKNKKEGTADL